MNNTPNKSFIARLDGLTLLLYTMLVVIGLCAIFSVEYKSTDTALLMLKKNYTKQLIFFGISLFVGLIIMFTDSKFFSSFAFLAYTLGIFLLIITIFVGRNVKGSHSWLDLGFIQFQPGEVCKIFTSLALAKYLSLTEINFKSLKDRVVSMVLIVLPALIIILQNETGLALVYMSFILVLYREGLPGYILVAGFSMVTLTVTTLIVEKTTLLIILLSIAVIIGAIIRKKLWRDHLTKLIFVGSLVFAIGFSQFVIPFVFKKVLEPHQIGRIYSMLGQDVPEEYVKEEKEEGKKKKDYFYNVNQSKIAIGSGGFWGKGFLNGTSTKNDFVPEQHTDFIFCSIGEQFGFVGSAALIIIYICLMLRIVHLAERQRSVFSRVYAYCVAAILFFHFSINISMTIGLAPVIGITLPFLSYGGSSLLSFSILLFILIRLDADRHVLLR